MPELPDEFTQVWLSLPAAAAVLEWALEQPAPLVLVTQSADSLDDETLESASEVIEAEDPDGFCCASAAEDDIVLLAWEDTPARHRHIRTLAANRVPVLDLADGFVELVLDDAPDVDDIVARVTAEVLKVVRAEMAEMLRSRRFRSAGPKV